MRWFSPVDVAEFDTRYPTPAHAAAAERRERVPPCDRNRFDYLQRCRARSLSALVAAINSSDQAFIEKTIAIADRMIAALERPVKR